MTVVGTSLRRAAPHDMPEHAGSRFYVFSVRAYELDFRQFLMESLRRKGHEVCHVHIGRSTKVMVDASARPIEFIGVSGFLALIRFLRERLKSSDNAVFIDSTGPYTPARSLLLRATLRPGLWCYDIFDNMSYDYRGLLRMRTRLAIPLLSRLSPVQLVLARETLRLFPKAVHLDNAAHTGRIERRNPNYRDMVLLSSIDERLDIAFVRRLAALAPDRNLYLYGRASSPQKLDTLCSERPNIVYRGEFTYDDIGEILRPFGVALAPYAVNKLTEYINPDKYYYFLNSGMEVISTDIPQARRMRDRIHVARSPADVPAIIDRLRDDAAFRKNTAGPVLSWDQRATDLLDIISRARSLQARAASRPRYGHPVR
jgi:hypothetical protein